MKTFTVINVAVLVVAAVVSWWLNNFDVKLTTENERKDSIRRIVRCALTLLIVQVAYCELWKCWHYNDQAAGIVYLATLVPLALIWLGCLSEAASRAFHFFVDPQDNRPYDPKKGERELEGVGHLIRSGRREEAIQLCRTLLLTTDENRAALEMMLHRMDVPVEAVKESKPLAEASRLRREGKFSEAEAVLNSLLAVQPSNVDAMLMLIRLYAQDMRRGERAAEILRSLEKQPHVRAEYLEFARRSIADWQKPKFPEVLPEPVPESLEELLAKKYFGTAVEVLGKKCEDEPGNFDNWLKLAEVHGLYCRNFPLAEKTVRRIETNPAFSGEQKDQARSRLREWRDTVEKNKAS